MMNSSTTVTFCFEELLLHYYYFWQGHLRSFKGGSKIKMFTCVCATLTCLYPSPLSQWMSLFSLVPAPFLSLFPVPSPALSRGCWLSCFSRSLRFWATVVVWGKTVGCVEAGSRCRGGGCQMWAVLLVPLWGQTCYWSLQGKGETGMGATVS